VVVGRIGLTSIDGFLELSRDDRCRLIGLRWSSSCSASEPESEDVDEPSPSSSEGEEDGPALLSDARVCNQLYAREMVIDLLCAVYAWLL
jgi:hypothetical protein